MFQEYAKENAQYFEMGKLSGSEGTYSTVSGMNSEYKQDLNRSLDSQDM